MRPDRADIAAPDFPAGVEWIGDDPGPMPALTASTPVLVQFIDFAQLNSVRTIPYLLEWDRRYRAAGLTTIAVQTPRFPFGGRPEIVRPGIERLGIDFPVALDSQRLAWLDYGCEGWPSLFLWGPGGVLRWFHFGEGEYLGTETAIQEELRSVDALAELPQPLASLRPTDAPGAVVIAPSSELLPAEDRPWTIEDGAELEVSYEAAGAWATLEGAGEIEVALDGERPRMVQIDGAGLYELAEHRLHGSHSLRIVIRPGVAVWSISFSPGPAPDEGT